MKTDNYEAGTKHYVAPNGISSLVKHFIKQAGKPAPSPQKKKKNTPNQNKTKKKKHVDVR